MASSVSSKRVFSQSGITISKQCSQLKGDIVEALQCVKCSLRNNLLFCKPSPSSVTEVESDEFEMEVEDDRQEMKDDDGDENGWDDLFLEEDDANLELDADMEDMEI